MAEGVAGPQTNYPSRLLWASLPLKGVVMWNMTAFENGLEIFPFVPVQGDEDEEHGGESPPGWAAITYQRKRDADNRHKADGHTYINK